MRVHIVFDLYLYPFGVQNNEEYTDLTGYFAGGVHRKANRTRVEDIIVLRFTTFKSLSDEEIIEINALVKKTGDQYYKTKGPITTAARKACDFLNNHLNQLNLKNNIKPPILGSLQFSVVNKDDLYLIQAGGATSYHLSRNKVEKFEERSHGVEGIGISKTINLRFFHTKITEGDRVIVSTKPPKTWTKESFQSNQKLSISHLRRTILDISDDNFEAIIIQFRRGNGSVHQLKLDSGEFTQTVSEEKIETHEESDQIPIPTPTSVDELSKIDNTFKSQSEFAPVQSYDTEPEILPEETQYKPQEEYDEPKELVGTFDYNQVDPDDYLEPQFEDKNLENKPNELQDGIFISGEVWESGQTQQKQEINKKQVAKRDSKSFAIFLLKIRKFFHSISERYGNFRRKIINSISKIGKSNTKSDVVAGSNSLSSASMLMITVLVAVFVSAIGISVYLQSGMGSRQLDLIANANLLISDALEESDVNNQIIMYQEALKMVNESENYGKSEAASELKTFLQSQLDSLQGMTRIEIQPTIFGGLDKRININRMAISSNGDVYALDSGTGRVIRMIATRPDYVIDTSFVCGPGKFDEVIVDQLIDIEVVNFANAINASLMGIDGRGNLIMCIPGNDPIAIALEKSEINWGNIKALAFNGYSLYILDTGEITRDIYRYEANGYSFDLIPESLFDGNIPDNLSESVDISVNQEELFLVHEDGQLTRCNLNQLSCDDNIGYGVIMNGETRENFNILPNTQFSQVQITYPPDPSIYFLDDKNQSIYHFSLAVNLQQQISPNISNLPNSLDDSSLLTAFAVSPNGIIHFAYGNLLYFGYLP